MLPRTRSHANGGIWRPSCASARGMMCRPILTAEAMRAAERAAIDSGTSVEQLMERAGAGLTEAAYRFSGRMDALILCGPGNNGGDGYVAARHLAARGVKVRVAALAEPKSEAAKWARGQWSGEVETLSADTRGAPLLIDALFGTGLTRGLDEALQPTPFRAGPRGVTCRSPATCRAGSRRISGALLNPLHDYDMTVAFGALKPAHLLHPAMHKCGRLVLADIGIAAAQSGTRSRRPCFRRSIPAGTNTTAGWSMRSRERCRGRLRCRPGPPRVQARAMSGSAPRGRSTAFRLRSSRSTMRRSTTSGSAACWSGRASATFRRC